MYAWMDGRLSEDIVAEQRKVEEAELIIFQVRDLSGLYCMELPFVTSAETHFLSFSDFSKLNHYATSTRPLTHLHTKHIKYIQVWASFKTPIICNIL